MEPNDVPSGRTIKSAGVALTILEVLSENDGAPLSTIAEQVDVSKSTVHHYLTTFRQRDYVVKRDGEYFLGVRFLTFGGQARERERVYQIGRPYVDRLASETGEIARLIVESRGVGIVLYQKEGNNVIDSRSHIGAQETLHSTAAGKAFLAHLSTDRIDTFLDEYPLTQYTDNTITDRNELESHLEQIRETGIAFDDEEHVEGVRCVAAPILSEDRTLLGAVSVSAPTARADDARFKSEFPNAIRNVVGAIEIDTTYSEWN